MLAACNTLGSFDKQPGQGKRELLESPRQLRAISEISRSAAHDRFGATPGDAHQPTLLLKLPLVRGPANAHRHLKQLYSSCIYTRVVAAAR